LVDAHALVDAVLSERMRTVEFPASLSFDHRQAVRRVAVDLVGRSDDERCVRAVLARRFEQHECAGGVHREVRVRLARGPVV